MLTKVVALRGDTAGDSRVAGNGVRAGGGGGGAGSKLALLNNSAVLKTALLEATVDNLGVSHGARGGEDSEKTVEEHCRLVDVRKVGRECEVDGEKADVPFRWCIYTSPELLSTVFNALRSLHSGRFSTLSDCSVRHKDGGRRAG